MASEWEAKIAMMAMTLRGMDALHFAKSSQGTCVTVETQAVKMPAPKLTNVAQIPALIISHAQVQSQVITCVPAKSERIVEMCAVGLQS